MLSMGGVKIQALTLLFPTMLESTVPDCRKQQIGWICYKADHHPKPVQWNGGDWQMNYFCELWLGFFVFSRGACI